MRVEIVTSVCTALRWKGAPELLYLPVSVLGSLADKAASLKIGLKTQEVYLTSLVAADVVVALCPCGCTSTWVVGGQAVLSPPRRPLLLLLPPLLGSFTNRIHSPGLLRQLSCL